MISWDNTTQIYPIRVLSTILSKQGHKIKIILAISYLEKLNDLNNPDITNRRMPGILEIIKDCEIVGLSFLSVHANNAEIIAKKIKEIYPDKIIISGGVHASVRPENTLKFSDYVCVGESENSFKLFVESIESRHKPDDIVGILSRNNSFDSYKASIPIENLDDIPIPQFFFDSTYIFIPERCDWVLRCSSMFIPIRAPIRGCYYLFPDRGCTGNCAYCCRPLLKKLSGIKKIRKRSVENIIDELSTVKKNIPNLQRVFIYSDDFLMWSTRELENFIRLYKNMIALPFAFYFSPHSYNDDKMSILLQSGYVQDYKMGIQTGSPKIRKIYNRTESNDKIIKVTKRVKMISKKNKIMPTYDFIITSPWETYNDKLETLKLICKIPRPFSCNFFTLIFYPGTKLYDLAIEDGYLDEQLYNEQFNLNNYISRKLRSGNEDTDLYINICRLRSVLPIPYFLVAMCYKHKIFLSIRLVNILAAFVREKIRSGYLIATFKLSKRIFSKIYRLVNSDLPPKKVDTLNSW